MSPSAMVRTRRGLYIPRSTFPSIPTVAGGRIITSHQNNTTSPRTGPALSGLTKNSGELLIWISADYGTNASTNWQTWSDGFTECGDLGISGVMPFGVAYKFSSGSESSAPTVARQNTITGDNSSIILSIPGAHASSPPEVGSGTNGTTSAANPSQVTPSWGALNTLWIVVMGNGATATTGTFDGITGAPSGYSNLATTGVSRTPSNVVGVTDLGVAFRQLNAATEDPAAGTVDTTNARNSAFLIAVRPA